MIKYIASHVRPLLLLLLLLLLMLLLFLPLLLPIITIILLLLFLQLLHIPNSFSIIQFLGNSVVTIPWSWYPACFDETNARVHTMGDSDLKKTKSLCSMFAHQLLGLINILQLSDHRYIYVLYYTRDLSCSSHPRLHGDIPYSCTLKSPKNGEWFAAALGTLVRFLMIQP